MKKKHIFSILVALVTSFVLGVAPVGAVNVSTDNSQGLVMTENSSARAGWTSGTANGYTSYVSFNSGTIYAAIRSSSTPSGSTGTYSVTLQKKTLFGHTDCGTLSIPCNGTITVNFPNQSSGNYRLYFNDPNNDHFQQYEILGYGTV